MKKILIAGAYGFVGTNLARDLAKSHTLLALDINKSDNTDYAAFYSSVKAAADSVQMGALTEETIPDPQGPYGASKLAAERYIQERSGSQAGGEGDKRFQDVAASLQVMYEEAFFHILNHLYKKAKSQNLALSGGCSQNSLANGKIYANTSFKNVCVPPAGHDAGGAIGAAFYLWNQILGNPRKFVIESAYWGPGFSRDEIKNILEVSKVSYEA